MQANKHPEYNEEKERLEHTEQAVDAFVGDSARCNSNADAGLESDDG